MFIFNLFFYHWSQSLSAFIIIVCHIHFWVWSDTVSGSSWSTSIFGWTISIINFSISNKYKEVKMFLTCKKSKELINFLPWNYRKKSTDANGYGRVPKSMSRTLDFCFELRLFRGNSLVRNKVLQSFRFHDRKDMKVRWDRSALPHNNNMKLKKKKKIKKTQ